MNLENLNQIVSDASVVGIGESAHFVHEFSQLRSKIVEFLSISGFSHLALEIGAIEAARINPWLQGEGSEKSLIEIAGVLTRGLYGNFLLAMRQLNQSSKVSLKILGVDLPNAMNFCAELEEIILYLKEVDPQLVKVVEEIHSIASKIPSGSAAVASSGWVSLHIDEQLKLEAYLSRILQRFNAIKQLYIEKSSVVSWEKAYDHVVTANNIKYMLHSMAELFSGNGLVADTSIREYHIANSILKALSKNQTMKILFVAHNNHIQKEPLYFDNYLTAYPAGYYLYQNLSEKYKAIALTHIEDKCPEMIFPVEQSSVGFRIDMVATSPRLEDSVENYVFNSGLSKQFQLLDLSSSEVSLKDLKSIRSQSVFTSTPIQRAFNAICSVPTATLDAGVKF